MEFSEKTFKKEFAQRLKRHESKNVFQTFVYEWGLPFLAFIFAATIILVVASWISVNWINPHESSCGNCAFYCESIKQSLCGR